MNSTAIRILYPVILSGKGLCVVMEIRSCRLCPRQCGVLRAAGPSNGFCGMAALPTAARAALHFGEEPCISGLRGSGTVFFTGCTMRCVYCQNAAISRQHVGETISVERLSDIFRELVDMGAHNINLVSPTPYVPAIVKALELYRPPIPIIYNTGGYERVETLRMLDGAVDVYLPDLKYIDSDLSSRLSHTADYFTYAEQAVLEMARQTGPFSLDDSGMAQKGTMIRHLVLPGHLHETYAVLDWIAGHLPKAVWVSLMFQYTPFVSEDYPELCRRLTKRECHKAVDHLLALGLTNGYIQDRSSAGSEFIPAFDLTGIVSVGS